MWPPPPILTVLISMEGIYTELYITRGMHHILGGSIFRAVHAYLEPCITLWYNVAVPVHTAIEKKFGIRVTRRAHFTHQLHTATCVYIQTPVYAMQDPPDAGRHQQPPPGGPAASRPRSPRWCSRQTPPHGPPSSGCHRRWGECGDVAPGQGRPHHEVWCVDELLWQKTSLVKLKRNLSKQSADICTWHAITNKNTWLAKKLPKMQLASM